MIPIIFCKHGTKTPINVPDLTAVGFNNIHKKETIKKAFKASLINPSLQN